MAVLDSIKTRATSLINLCYHEEDFGLEGEWNSLQQAMEKVPATELVEQ